MPFGKWENGQTRPLLCLGGTRLVLKLLTVVSDSGDCFPYSVMLCVLKLGATCGCLHSLEHSFQSKQEFLPPSVLLCYKSVTDIASYYFRKISVRSCWFVMMPCSQSRLCFHSTPLSWLLCVNAFGKESQVPAVTEGNEGSWTRLALPSNHHKKKELKEEEGSRKGSGRKLLYWLSALLSLTEKLPSASWVVLTKQ